MAAARASWFALPVTKLSKVKPRFSRERSWIGASAAGLVPTGRGRATGSAPRGGAPPRPGPAGGPQPQAELASARFGGQALDAGGEAFTDEFEHETIGRGQREGVAR